MKSFQEILRTLTEFWEKQGCVVHQGYDLEVGAGTFNPATFLRALGPEPYRAAYIEPSRRPSDGRFGENPIRFQHYFQYQVILKPSPPDILDLYLKSLEAIGFDLKKHDIRFVHDDWEGPTLGAWGLGWEVWMDGMEVTQFTYFQSVGGQELHPVTGEITYGIERLSTFLQGVNSTFDLQWADDVTYGDIYKRNEFEWSHYNFTHANTEMWFRHFVDYEKEAKQLIQQKLPIPAYDFVMKASHAFNLLDARGAISVSERSGYIGRIRDLSKLVAQGYLESRKEQDYPLLHRFKSQMIKEKELPAIPKALLEPKAEAKEDFLLEIGVEELPAEFVNSGIEGLKKGVKEILEAHQIPYKNILGYGTPRRLSILIEKMGLKTSSKNIEKKGPSITAAFNEKGELTQIGQGFFRANNLSPTSLHQLPKNLEIRNQYLFAKFEEKSQPTALILQQKLPETILKIDFPKKMRWGSEEIAFARPIRWIVALIGAHPLPIKIGSVISDRFSYGHRQLDPLQFEITAPDRYLEELRSHYVLADCDERKLNITLQLNKIEKEVQGTIVARTKVMDEVVNLVEWPFVTYASFNEEYLKAPKEILISEMVVHQKYFPVEDNSGGLKNLFVITANNTPTDLIRQGNQKVLSARLYDGKFLFEQDLKIPIEKFNEKLKSVMFLQGLGTMHDKVVRLKKHVKSILQFLPITDPKLAERAAELAKFDLCTGAVYEFPELQGTMGQIYALHAGEKKEVARSIEEQWMPRGENAPLPQSTTGIVLSLADKIDNLISCFGMGLKPSSSSDPYALRRQVLGMIRILIQGKYNLNLKDLLNECIKHFDKLSEPHAQTIDEITQFILARIKTVFLGDQISKEDIEASLSLGFNDIYDIYCRITALKSFREQHKAFPKLLEVYRRAKGQIPERFSISIDEKLFKEPSERALYQFLKNIDRELNQAIQTRDYPKAYQEMASLQPYIAKLYDEVKILAEDPQIQNNRLSLLQMVLNFFGKLVDFSKIK